MNFNKLKLKLKDLYLCFRIGKFSIIQTKFFSYIYLQKKCTPLYLKLRDYMSIKKVNWTSLYRQSSLWLVVTILVFTENLYWQSLLAQYSLTQSLLKVFTHLVNLKVNYDIYWKQSQAKQRMDIIKLIIMQHFCCEAMIYSVSLINISNTSTLVVV